MALPCQLFPELFCCHNPREYRGRVIQERWFSVDDSCMARRDLLIMFEVVLGDWFLAEHVEIRD